MIRLQSGILWSDGSRQVTAVDVARCLIDRSDPSSPKYQARWADLLDRVESPDDTRVEVRLNRPLIRLGLLVRPARSARRTRGSTAGSRPPGKSACSSATAPSAAGPPPSRRSSSSWRRSAVEHRGPAAVAASGGSASSGTPGPRPAVAALVRGDVSLAAHVPPDQVAALSANPEIKVGRYSQPAIHLIALDGRNRVLKNRSLRRGLSYAIDRKTILEETILGHPGDAENTVADGPIAQGLLCRRAGRQAARLQRRPWPRC